MSGESTSKEALAVAAEGGAVVVRGPRLAAVALEPDAAARLAERLLEAADQVREATDPAEGGLRRRKAPFPPAQLVSPHGAA